MEPLSHGSAVRYKRATPTVLRGGLQTEQIARCILYTVKVLNRKCISLVPNGLESFVRVVEVVCQVTILGLLGREPIAQVEEAILVEWRPAVVFESGVVQHVKPMHPAPGMQCHYRPINLVILEP